jgi:hypothetical protein
VELNLVVAPPYQPFIGVVSARARLKLEPNLNFTPSLPTSPCAPLK